MMCIHYDEGVAILYVADAILAYTDRDWQCVMMCVA